MNCDEAFAVLDKFQLRNVCDVEFANKTRRDRGRMNLALKFRIYANHLCNEAYKLEERRRTVVKCNTAVCPHFQEALKNNPYAHQECSFILLFDPEKFCYSCDFYLSEVQPLDDGARELREAAKYFEDEANYDDTWR